MLTFPSEDQSSQLPSSSLLQRLWELREKLIHVESLSDLPESWLERKFFREKKPLGHGVEVLEASGPKGRNVTPSTKWRKVERKKQQTGNVLIDILGEFRKDWKESRLDWMKCG